MSARNFREGNCYFLVSYYDQTLRIPEISTYVYLGQNILGSGRDGDRWYFQEAESWVKDGPFDPQTRRNSERLLTAGNDSVADFLDGSELIEEIRNLLTGSP